MPSSSQLPRGSIQENRSTAQIKHTSRPSLSGSVPRAAPPGRSRHEAAAEALTADLLSAEFGLRLRALRTIKNHIIGNRTKKLTYIDKGAAARIVHILGSETNPAILFQGAAAVGSFACGTEAGARAMLEEGAVPALLKALDACKDPKVTETSLRSLRMLLRSSALMVSFADCAWSSPDTLAQLFLRLLQSPTDQVAAVVSAVLSACCTKAEHQDALAKAHAVPALSSLLTETTGSLRKAEVLLSLISVIKGRPDLSQQLTDWNGGAALSECMRLVVAASSQTRARACACLALILRGGAGLDLGWESRRETAEGADAPMPPDGGTKRGWQAAALVNPRTRETCQGAGGSESAEGAATRAIGRALSEPSLPGCHAASQGPGPSDFRGDKALGTEEQPLQSEREQQPQQQGGQGQHEGRSGEEPLVKRQKFSGGFLLKKPKKPGVSPLHLGATATAGAMGKGARESCVLAGTSQLELELLLVKELLGLIQMVGEDGERSMEMLLLLLEGRPDLQQAAFKMGALGDLMSLLRCDDKDGLPHQHALQAASRGSLFSSMSNHSAFGDFFGASPLGICNTVIPHWMVHPQGTRASAAPAYSVPSSPNPTALPATGQKKGRATLQHLNERQLTYVLSIIAEISSDISNAQEQLFELDFSPQLTGSLLPALDHPSLRVRCAASKCFLSLSRSIKNLHRGLASLTVAFPLLALTAEADPSLQACATAALANIVIDFLPPRRLLLHAGLAFNMATLAAYKGDPKLRCNAVVVLKNFSLLSSSDMKAQVLAKLTPGLILDLLQDKEQEVQLHSFGLLKNMSHGPEQDINAVVSLGAGDVVREAAKKVQEAAALGSDLWLADKDGRQLMSAVELQTYIEAMYVLTNVAAGIAGHKDFVLSLLMPTGNKVSSLTNGDIHAPRHTEEVSTAVVDMFEPVRDKFDECRTEEERNPLECSTAGKLGGAEDERGKVGDPAQRAPVPNALLSVLHWYTRQPGLLLAALWCARNLVHPEAEGAARRMQALEAPLEGMSLKEELESLLWHTEKDIASCARGLMELKTSLTLV